MTTLSYSDTILNVLISKKERITFVKAKFVNFKLNLSVRQKCSEGKLLSNARELKLSNSIVKNTDRYLILFICISFFICFFHIHVSTLHWYVN